MQRKPEQMHVPPPQQEQERVNPRFTLKELIRLNGMKWLKERGLQYDSSHDDGDYLHLCSNHPTK